MTPINLAGLDPEDISAILGNVQAGRRLDQSGMDMLLREKERQSARQAAQIARADRLKQLAAEAEESKRRFGIEQQNKQSEIQLKQGYLTLAKLKSDLASAMQPLEKQMLQKQIAEVSKNIENIQSVMDQRIAGHELDKKKFEYQKQNDLANLAMEATKLKEKKEADKQKFEQQKILKGIDLTNAKALQDNTLKNKKLYAEHEKQLTSGKELSLKDQDTIDNLKFQAAKSTEVISNNELDDINTEWPKRKVFVKAENHNPFNPFVFTIIEELYPEKWKSDVRKIVSQDVTALQYQGKPMTKAKFLELADQAKLTPEQLIAKLIKKRTVK